MIKVSVIIPTYNVEKYIGRCLDSVRGQTLKDIEIIVVNDASPDNSIDIVQERALGDSRIIIVNNNCNKGPMVSRHNGCLIARGSYLTFLDADDWLPSDALEKLYNKAITDDSDLVCGTILRIDENGKEHGRWGNKLPYGSDRIAAFKAILRRKVKQNLCSKLFRTSLFQDRKYIVFDNNTNAEDAAVLFQFVNGINKISVINDDVYMYFMNSSSASYNLTLRSLRCICENTKLRNNLLSSYPQLEDDRMRYFTNNLAALKVNQQQLDVIREYGLEEFVSNHSIIKYGSIKTMLSIVVKRLLSII